MLLIQRYTSRPPYRIVLRPSRAVDVSVVDSAGNPVADATVHVLYTYSLTTVTKTDASGKVRLFISKDAENPCITAFKSGVGMDYFGRDTEPPYGSSAVPKSLKLVLNGTAPLESQVLDMAGTPVPGVSVELWTIKKKGKDLLRFSETALAATTDAHGRATFDWIPADLDRIEFVAQSDEYVTPATSPFRIEEGGDPRHLTARVLRKSQFSGRVTYPDGRPAAGIIVQAEGIGKSSFPWTLRKHRPTERISSRWPPTALATSPS